MDYNEMLKRATSNLPKKKQAERFEIPKALTSLAGRQTIIKNFSDIAKTLRREPKQLAKYLFKELAIPGSINNNELVLQGKISTYMIDQRIRDYIRDFVMCHECNKPDTNIIDEKGITIIKCEACGARRSFRG